MKFYQPADGELWTGRSVPAGQPPQYWYQVTQTVDLDSTNPDLRGRTVLLGYAVDEGVRRNQGRVGAAGGPDAARGRLGRLAYHAEWQPIVDAGNVHCPDGNLVATQQELSHRVTQICRAGGRPLIIGGGHDVAYGHFRGLHRSYGGSNTQFGVINFDAHLDLRTPVEGPTSGTPFQQILNEFGATTRYLAVGIQRAANPPALYDTAERLGVHIIPEPDCIWDAEGVIQRIQAFAGGVDHVYLTVDLDGFSGSIAPGVSAPNPGGLSFAFVARALEALIGSNKIIGADIAEFNPAADVNELTRKLLSRIVFQLATPI